MTPDPRTIDLALLGVIALSMLVGIWRGLLFEVLSLLGWVAAFVAAQAFAGDVARLLPVGAPGSALNLAAGFALTFIVVLVVWGLAARLLRALVHATALSGLDRVLGGGFGVLRGVVVLLALATVIALTPAKKSPIWQQSQVAHVLSSMLRGLKPLLPSDFARRLPA